MNRFFCTICLVSLAAGIGLLGGCSRQYYRTKADHNVYSILQQANRDPRWKVDDPQITPDSASRMYDPFCPDHEPMPVDDPAAHQKMHQVDGMPGSPGWHAAGQTDTVENPNWRFHLLVNEKGEIPLDKEQAVELSILHSPEYQSARENLYLAAAQVSQERFKYDVQFFGGDSLLYTGAGKLIGDSSVNSAAKLRAEKLLATGGNWWIELANNITWTLSGQKSWSADTFINVGLLQPLLRGASKKVQLESLTQTERQFLSELRQMVLYQQGHYTQIVAGAGHKSIPGNLSSAAYTPMSGGFYNLLAQQIQIQNQRQNILGLEENLNRFIEMFNAGQIADRSQVEETRQSLLNAQNDLLLSVNSYQANVERYIRSLGLPPDLKVQIDDPLLEQFQLTSPSITELQENVADLLTQIRTKDEPLPEDLQTQVQMFAEKAKGEIAILEQDLESLDNRMPDRIQELQNLEGIIAQRIVKGERFNPVIYDTKAFEDRIQELRSRDISRTLSRLQRLFVLIDVIVQSDESALRQTIQEKSFAPDAEQAIEYLNLNISESDAVDAEIAERQAELDKTDAELNMLEQEYNLSSPRETSPEVLKIIAELREKDDYRDWVRRVISTFQYELLSLSLMQTRARLDAMTLIPVSISSEEAFQTAAENRLDWMNRKSELVDSWRQIDIAADGLRRQLDFEFTGQAGTIDKSGVQFRDDTSKLTVGLRWDSPLSRHTEMLEYRSKQIAYQNARRNYYTYVDEVQATLQDRLRNVQRRRIEFEINRNAVLVGTIRVDVMQLRMEQPPARGGTLDTNISRQLIDALNGLTQSQNRLLETWVAYQTERMLLDLDLGTMQLDDRGIWVDPGVIGGSSSETPPDLAPILVPVLTIPKLNRRYVEE